MAAPERAALCHRLTPGTALLDRPFLPRRAQIVRRFCDPSIF